MIRYEDECVGCPPEMGCLGEGCPNMKVPRYYCDCCGDEFYPEDLYLYDDKMWCKECLIDELFKGISSVA